MRQYVTKAWTWREAIGCPLGAIGEWHIQSWIRVSRSKPEVNSPFVLCLCLNQQYAGGLAICWQINSTAWRRGWQRPECRGRLTTDPIPLSLSILTFITTCPSNPPWPTLSRQVSLNLQEFSYWEDDKKWNWKRKGGWKGEVRMAQFKTVGCSQMPPSVLAVLLQHNTLCSVLGAFPDEGWPIDLFLWSLQWERLKDGRCHSLVTKDSLW